MLSREGSAGQCRTAVRGPCYGLRATTPAPTVPKAAASSRAPSDPGVRGHRPARQDLVPCRLACPDDDARRDRAMSLGGDTRAEEGQEVVREQRIEGALVDAEVVDALDRDVAKAGAAKALVERDLRQRTGQAAGPGGPGGGGLRREGGGGGGFYVCRRGRVARRGGPAAATARSIISGRKSMPITSPVGPT